MVAPSGTSVQRAQEAMAFAGGAEVSWSVVLEARLAQAPSAEQIAERLEATLPTEYPELAVPLPVPRRAAAGELERVRAELAGRPYALDEPAMRLVVVEDDPPALLLAAHHGALDGLGLLGLLGVALGAPVTSTVRGVADRPPERSFPRVVAGRVAEALLAPPARVAPAVRDPSAGDVLVSRTIDGSVPSAGPLLAAARRAVLAWNAEHDGDRRRFVVNIGASRRDGSAPRLERRAAYLRLHLDGTPDAALPELLRRAAPEPIVEQPGRLAVVASLGRPLARRLGATVLLSSLGQVSGADGVQRLAFFPLAHGRSGVALGATGHGERATLSLRARGSDFAPAHGADLLARWADALPAARGRTGAAAVR